MSENIDLQDQILNTAAEAHSAQDGIYLAVITALVVTGSPLLQTAAVVLGFGGAKVANKAILKQASGLVRIDQIRNNPEYFVLTYTTGTVAFTALLHYAGMYLPGL